MRHSDDMTPTKLTTKVPADIQQFVSLLVPEDATEAPILSKSVRGAVHQWMTEINAVEELDKVGLKPRTSCILAGPPGCGKTTLAHHFSSRLGLPLMVVHLDRLVSCYIGSTGNNIASIFEAFTKNPEGQILFFDEFDSVASKRTTDGQSAAKERNSIVSSLLTRIEAYKGVMIAATNFSDNIDPAIWRRFGIHLTIDLPDDEGRFAILKRYLQPFILPDSSLQIIADATEGAPPSLLRQLMEGIKRDMILAPRLKLDASVNAVFMRLISSCRPHESYKSMPPLWDPDDEHHSGKIDSMAWPPTMPDK